MDYEECIDRLSSWLQDLAVNLELAHWDVILASTPIDDDGDEALADITITPGRNEAHLRIGKSFFVQSRERQRTIAVHELLHLHHRLLNQFRGRIVSRLGTLVGQILCDELEDAEEFAVDAIAMAVSKHFPLPPQL